MNIAVPSRPVRPIRAKRELREGGTRCSSRISAYLLFSLQIRGKNDLSPARARSLARSHALARIADAESRARAAHLSLSAAARPAAEPGGGARRQKEQGNDEISAVNLLETPPARPIAPRTPARVRECVCT